MSYFVGTRFSARGICQTVPGSAYTELMVCQKRPVWKVVSFVSFVPCFVRSAAMAISKFAVLLPVMHHRSL